ncbi:MAG: molybdopterin molybdotransferase MoeA [Candidatus Bathyarchaeia archaeon]|nr:molybdopterin molybdotransferase MoeA [Candidatus Bathyarchaeota archaeon]
MNVKDRRVMRIEEALKVFYRSINLARLDVETLPLKGALDRVTASDIAAPVDIPQFNLSAVDGYAVLASDTFGASPANPVILKIKEPRDGVYLSLRSGEAAYVSTGSPIPAGSDAVVMLEYTKKIEQDIIEVYKAVSPGEDVSWRGEDVRKGETVLREGVRLKPQDLGMLASMGFTSVNVYRRPVVGIISTGSELVPLGSERRFGRVIDVNSIILSAMTIDYGGEPLPLGIVEDDFEKLRSKIRIGLAKSDILVLTGGTSVGKADLTVGAIDSFGPPGIVVHGVAMRPGRPTALASIESKPVINLSGYPVAAMIGFYVFGKDLISRMLRTVDEPEPHVFAKVTRRIPSPPGIRSYVRVNVLRRGSDLIAEPVRSTGSGIISSMVRANGLLVIPEDVEGVDEGEVVEVVLMRSIRDL